MRSNQPLSPLTAHLGYWMRLVSNHVSHGFARKLAERDVTVAEWVMLRQLYDEDALAPSRLAERMGMTRGAITKLADRLIAKALVVRIDHPDDGRAQTLALTKQGRRLVPTLAALADENDAAFFGHFTPEERSRIEQFLKAIVDRHGLTDVPVS